MGRKRKNKRRKPTRAQRIPAPNKVSEDKPKSTESSAHTSTPRRGWIAAILISAIGAVAATGIGVFTPIFRADLSVAPVPAVVDQMGVHGDSHKARHIVALHFCVKNAGLIAGNVSRLEVNAIGLPEIPSVVVQRLDHAPISPLSKRGISADLVLDDKLSLPPKARMHIDVYDDADRWIGAFEIEVPRPWTFERKLDGSTVGSARVAISGRSLDPCKDVGDTGRKP